MPVVSCQQCGKEFNTRPSRLGITKYCSITCRYKGRRRTSILKCSHCKKEIEIKASKAKYRKFCSLSCKHKNITLIRNYKKICLACNKEFMHPKNKEEKGIGGKYCSIKCAGMEKNRIKRICKKCNCEFETIPSHIKRGIAIYCSVKCAGNEKNRIEKKCLNCGELFSKTPKFFKDGNGKYCSRECYFKSVSPTSIEILLEEEIKKLGLRYESQKKIGRWSIDFFIPLKNLAVEADGTYWHTKDRKVIERDLCKNKWLREHGYHVIRIPEHEIKIDPEEALMSRLAPFLQQGEMMNG